MRPFWSNLCSQPAGSGELFTAVAAASWPLAGGVPDALLFRDRVEPRVPVAFGVLAACMGGMAVLASAAGGGAICSGSGGSEAGGIEGGVPPDDSFLRMASMDCMEDT